MTPVLPGVCPPIQPAYTADATESSSTIVGRLAAQEVATKRLLKIVADQQTTIGNLRKQVDLLAKDNAMLVQSVAAMATTVAVDRSEPAEGFSAPTTGR